MNIKIFAGDQNPELAQRIAKHLKIQLGKIEIKKFANGEERAQLCESVNGRDVFLVQSTTPPAENFVRALQMIDAAKRGRAHRINMVIPDFGWGRQDRIDRPRAPITARIQASCIESVGAHGVLTMDLHKSQIVGFFSIPVSQIFARTILLDWLKKSKPKNPVVIVPDEGAAVSARWYAERLGVRRVYVDKERNSEGHTKVDEITGTIGENDTAIIVDDIIDTGGTIINTMVSLKEKRGVKKFIVMATHGELSGSAIDRLNSSYATTIVITDTIEQPEEKKKALMSSKSKFKIVSVAGMFAEAIKRLHTGEGSLSDLAE